METQFNQLSTKRRSIYNLGKNINIADKVLFSVIKQAVRNSPSAFNSQSVRTVVLLGNKSDKVWDITEKALEKIAKDPQSFDETKEKIASFRAGYGTILFLTDTTTVHKLENDFPPYAENFADWAEQSIGGTQQAVWTALAELNIGASLQHYNPLIDDEIHKEFSLPNSWKLRAEMPFGSIESPAGSKDFLSEDKVFKFFK